MARVTKEQVIQALEENNGVVSDAAKALGVSRSTVYNKINASDDIKQAFDNINETTIDEVEKKMYDLMMDGNTTLIIFYLKTKAKHRGYVERQELTGKNGEAIILKTGMDTDEL